MLAIKAALNLEDYERGVTIHRMVIDSQFPPSIQLKNTMIDFYGHFGEIHTAMDIFESIPDAQKDAVTISTMMKCQMNSGHPLDTLSIYNRFRAVTNDVCHVLAVKACSETGDFQRGQQIHNALDGLGERQSIQLRNTMIDFYGRFGYIDSAIQIFEGITDSEKDSISLNAMMTVFMEHQRESEAMSLYDRWSNGQCDLRDDTSDLLALKSCIVLNDRHRGMAVINERIGDPQSHRVEVQNILIDFYGHFGDVHKAQSIYDLVEDESREIVMVNAMMKALINNGDAHSELDIYDRFERKHESYSHLTAIKGCIVANEYERGVAIDERVGPNSKLDFKSDLKLESDSISNSKYSGTKITDIFISSALVDFYGTFGIVERAEVIFKSINPTEINTVCINAMMKAFLKNGHYERVLEVYHEFESFRDDISHLSALKATIELHDFERGLAIHRAIVSHGEVRSVEVDNMSIEFYGHFGEIESAEAIFDGIPPLKKDVISVNSMMTVLLEGDRPDDALNLYDDTLQSTPQRTDDISHLLALQGCIRTADYDRGQAIKQKIDDSAKERALSLNLRNSLIDFYGHFGEMESAQAIYDSIPDEDKTIVTVGAMMEALCNCTRNMDCIELFEAIPSMKGMVRNTICYSIVFKACTQATAFHIGRDIHERLKCDDQNKEMLEDPSIQINLIEFYAKCGSLATSQEMFDDIECKDISVWNAMIKAYGRNGDIESALRIYERMDVEANCKTFTILLNACNHSGNVEEALRIWKEEMVDEDMKYDSFVVATLVDCFGRRGLLDEAQTMVIDYEERKSKEHPNDVTMWKSLLNGCKLHHDGERAEGVFVEMQNRLKTLSDADMAAASVILSNAYIPPDGYIYD